MNDSLEDFLHDVLQDHDNMVSQGPQPATGPGMPTLASPHRAPAGGGTVAAGTLPGHAVEGLLGRGGMGMVYRAHQQALERDVAVKVMTVPGGTAEMAGRFRREALVLARLEHPNIVPIHEMGVDAAGQLYYSMKLVKGRTLQDILHRLAQGDAETLRQFPLAALLTIFRKVCDALAFAHSHGVLHRDLKPENIMVGEFGEVLVLDWGLAKLMGAEGRESGPCDIAVASTEAAEAPADGSSVDSFRTLDGAVIGTPQYMSPEQALGQVDELDARSDIFSLGGILYAILTLRPPVEGATLQEILQKVRTGSISSPSVHGTLSGSSRAQAKEGVVEAGRVRPLPHIPAGRAPPALCAVVMKALKLDKAQRYQSAADLNADIEAYQGGFATKAQHAGALRQLQLLMLRHKAVSFSLLVLLLTSAVFVLKVMASERVAAHNAEQSRRSLARAQIVLADSAFRSVDEAAMGQALDACPEDLRDQSWRYLSDRRDMSLRPLAIPGFAGADEVLAVPGAPGQFVLSNESPSIVVVDTAEDRILKTIETGMTGRKILAISGDGRVLAVAHSTRRKVQMYDMAAGAHLRDLKVQRKLSALALNPDGSRLLAIPQYESPLLPAQLVDTRDGSILWTRKIPVKAASFSPDGTVICTSAAGRFRLVSLLKTSDGSQVVQVPMDVGSHALSPDGKVAAVGLRTGEMLLLDTTTGAVIRQSKVSPGGINGLAWTRGGFLLTMGDQGKFGEGRWTFRLWNPEDLSPLATLFGLPPGVNTPWSLDVASGTLLTLGATPRVWRLPVGRERARLTHVSEQGWACAFLSDSVLLSRKRFGLARYDVSVPGGMVELADTLLPSGGFSQCASHWPSGRFAIAARNGFREPLGLRILAQEQGQLVQQLALPMERHIMDLDFDTPGDRVAVVTAQSSLDVFEVASGKPLLAVSGQFSRVAFAGAGGALVAVSSSRRAVENVEDKLALYDGASGAPLHVVTRPFRISSLAVSPDRRQIAIGGSDQAVHFFDAETLQETHAFRVHDAEVTALRFHPSLPILATASMDRSVKLWDYPSASLRDQFLGLRGTPVCLAFSPNGRLLAVDGQETTTRLFDVELGEGP